VYRQAQLEEDLPEIEREKKIIIEVNGEEKQMFEFKAAPKLRRSTGKRSRSPGSVADAVSGFLREEAMQDIKISFPLFIYKALHLRRVWLDIIASKLTAICVRHWSKLKFYNFPIAALQHLLSEKTSNRPLYAAYFT